MSARFGWCCLRTAMAASTGGVIGALRPVLAALVLLALIGDAPAWAGARTGAGRGPALRRLLVVHQGEHVAVLSVSAIEWGTPDRWSFTSRCAYMFGSVAARERSRWVDTVALTASPGLDGGRVGLGYQFVAKTGPDLALIGEARGVLLRTWRSPMVVGPERTFAGAELRGSLVGFLVASVGWYGRVRGAEGGRDHFWGYHVGVGL